MLSRFHFTRTTSLTLSTLGIIFSRRHFEIFFFFSPGATICMKCQVLISRKNKNHIINVSSVELAQSGCVLEYLPKLWSSIFYMLSPFDKFYHLEMEMFLTKLISMLFSVLKHLEELTQMNALLSYWIFILYLFIPKFLKWPLPTVNLDASHCCK